MVDTSGMGFQPGSLAETIYDIWVGIAVGAGHNFYFVKKFLSQLFLNPIFRVLGFPVEEEQKSLQLKEGEEAELKVVGVGYGRTGTYSLTLALEDLGFPTLHTQHLYENEEIFEMWTEQVFRPSYIAKERTMGTPDIDMIAKSGYQGTMDLPMALYYEKVLENYPDCKFILTVRESSEIWFKSWDTLLKSITQPARYARNILPFMNRFGLYFRWLSAVVNTDDSYFTTEWPLPDQQKAPSIASYEAHNARVREVIPPEQLLEYSVKEGWEPLCNFLEIADCPTVPFPKSNSARSVQVQSVSALVLPLVIVLFALFYGVASFVKKTTGKTVLGWANMKCVQFQRSLMGSPPPVRKAFKSA